MLAHPANRPARGAMESRAHVDRNEETLLSRGYLDLRQTVQVTEGGNCRTGARLLSSRHRLSRGLTGAGTNECERCELAPFTSNRAIVAIGLWPTRWSVIL